MPLIAMQHDGIRLQQAGMKIGRNRRPAKQGESGRSDEVNREPCEPRENFLTTDYTDEHGFLSPSGLAYL
jgi:hypothetical protein